MDVKTPLNHFEEFNAATNGEPAKILELMASECIDLLTLLALPKANLQPFEALAITRTARQMYVSLSSIKERILAKV